MANNGPKVHETLAGQITQVLYQDPDKGFAVVQILHQGRFETAAGELSPVHEGEEVRLHGHWHQHPKFGRQFKVSWSEHESPTTQEGLRRYLGSGAFEGVGPDVADRLVAHFGEETLAALEAGTEKLQEVRGIGPVRAEALAEAFQEGWQRHRVLAELRGLGLNGGQARELYQRHQAGAVARIRRDPYALIAELRGFGFQSAENLARNLGLPEDSPARARGLIRHLLRQAAGEGHACLPETELHPKLEQLGLSEQSRDQAFQDLLEDGRLAVEKVSAPVDPAPDLEPAEALGWWYLSGLWQDEQGVAHHVRRLLNQPPSAPGDPQAVIAAMARSGFRPDESQRQALEMALLRSFSVMTGGPGTGKTTTLRLLLDILEAQGVGPISLASPTGRAAKRLQEATGRKASTIHRLLGFEPHNMAFRHHEDLPLEAEFLIVDEVSMLDLPLAHALLQAVPDTCRVLFVGDADQLPSVGPGTVLRDLVTSEVVPTTRLRFLHRQGRGSAIAAAAHEVLGGRIPASSPQGGSGSGDFFVVYPRDPHHAVTLIERLIQERMPERYGLDPGKDVLVLAPMYRGPLGVDALNQRLSQVLNPDGKAEDWCQPYRQGDRVMVIRNDYEREVFNGDVGQVSAISPTTLTVELDSGLQEYDREQLQDLVPAYCVTVHRAQGSEAKAVIVVLDRSHFLLLRRSLFYTAMTRGKSLVVVVAAPAALRRAVANNTESRRFGLLGRRLTSFEQN